MMGRDAERKKDWEEERKELGRQGIKIRDMETHIKDAGNFEVS